MLRFPHVFILVGRCACVCLYDQAKRKSHCSVLPFAAVLSLSLYFHSATVNVALISAKRQASRLDSKDLSADIGPPECEDLYVLQGR